jgi:di/tricarboxylate transporter
MFRADRRPAATTAEAASGPPADAPAATGALRAGLVLAVVVALWATTAWHPFEPMLVAVLGAVAVTLPRFGVLGLSQALKGVDWSVILLLAAAAHLSEAAAANDLVAAGTADLGALLRQEHGIADGWLIAAMTAVAMLAHLAISSRSARALLLLPVALTVASAAALDPVVVVLAVTAGTGFCVLTPVGSKALIIFAGGDGRDFDKQALLRAGLVLLPIQLAITLGFAAWVWPAFGTTGG